MSHSNGNLENQENTSNESKTVDEDLEGIPPWIIQLMEHQPTINLMTLGDVSHGKSTLMFALSGEHTSRHGEEKRKNMTIKLGYTSCKIWKCKVCPPPKCYFTLASHKSSSHHPSEIDAQTVVQCPNMYVDDDEPVATTTNTNTTSPGNESGDKAKTSDGAKEAASPQNETQGGQKEKAEEKANVTTANDKHRGTSRCTSTNTNGNVILVRHVSFVDCPGHASLMGTMISAACVADGALMVVDSSRPCPGLQTVQHTNAAYVLGVLTNDYTDQPKLENYQKYTKVVVSQNKIDLVEKKEACLHYESIKNFLRSYSTHLAIETPILPISAQSKLNIDALLMVITKRLPPYSARLIPSPQNKSTHIHATLNKGPLDDQELRINIIRSFDVNRGMELKEAADVDKIQGGVVGGVILSGVLRLGQVVEIRPGLILNDDDGNFVVYPIRSHVHHIQCGVQVLSEVYPGANVGVQLNIDPFLTKGDRMVGHVMISVDLGDDEKTTDKSLEDDADENINQKPFEKKPPVFYKCVLTYVLLEGYEKAPFNKGETLRLNVGSVKVNGTVTKPKVKLTSDKGESKVAISVELSSPICADVGSLCAITRNIKKKWVLAAGAVIQSVQSMTLQHVGSHV